MKKIKIIVALFIMAMALVACRGTKVEAAASRGVSVNVSTNIDIVFREDGSTSVSKMSLENDSLVPIELRGIYVSEFNGWKLVSWNHDILVDQKKLALIVENTELQAGKNEIPYRVSENSTYDFLIKVKRGAWTTSAESEKALEFEVEYQIGTKDFALVLDANNGKTMETIYAKNGSLVELPQPTKDGYEFVAWEDEEGIQYTNQYVMPIGDTSLKAVWKKVHVYGIYSSEDASFTLVKTVDEIQVGSKYNGKVVSAVYTGMEELVYENRSAVPWYADGNYKNVKKVVVRDVISPISTAYWFYGMEKCGSFDVKNLDTSHVTTMRSMFEMSGRTTDVSSYIITGMDTWNTARVTDMQRMFYSSGVYARNVNIGDVGKWNVSNVTDMNHLFYAFGFRCPNPYIGDLSNWNTQRVTNMVSMFENFANMSESASIGNIGKWDVSNVTNMAYMFAYAFTKCDEISIGDLSNWNVSKVTSLQYTFFQFAMYVPSWNFGNFGNWNVSNVTNFFCTFYNAGMHSKTFYIGNLEKWNTAKATTMGNMFEGAGMEASWSLNLRNWNVDNVTYYLQFNKDVENKVTEPVWKHPAD